MGAMKPGLAHETAPHAKIDETEKKYVIELAVTDFGVRELSVEVKDGVVTVKGEQQRVGSDEPFAFRERLEESFRLPDDVDVRHLVAYYDRGTLEIHAPKRREAGRHKVPILDKDDRFVHGGDEPC